MKGVRTTGNSPAIRLLPIALAPIIVLLLSGVALEADRLGGWGTVAALVGMVALGVAVAVALRLHEWRRPFSRDDLAGDALWRWLRGRKGGRFSPVQVEGALHDRLVEWAGGLERSDEVNVLFHRHAHADYDARIIDPDGGEAGTRVCLVQAKARPVPATLRRFAVVMHREDAHEAILFTARASLETRNGADLISLGVTLGVRLAEIADLDNVLHGDRPTVEVYGAPDPPGSPVWDLVEF